MNIDEAVVILNREKWREQDDWYAPDTDGCTERFMRDEDLIAIASYLELREAVKPFVAASIKLPAIADYHNHATVRSSVVLQTLIEALPTGDEWRRLAALMPSAADSSQQPEPGEPGQ